MIVGAGFGGLAAARALRRADAEVLVIDRQNHHLFQPLLYQVATAALAPSNIAAPVRRVLRRQQNARTVLGEARAVDTEGRRIRVVTPQGHDAWVDYDFLVLAAGTTNDYFGHDEWAEHAVGLKTIDEALAMRRRFLLAFEEAEVESDPERRRRLLTFVIIGGGPTGVELAGAMSEIARTVIDDEFHRIDPRDARVILVEGGERLLTSMPPPLSDRARRDLESLGVEVRLGRFAAAVDPDGVTTRRAGADDGDPEAEERIDAATVFWAAGQKAVRVAGTLGDDVTRDRAGRIEVAADLSLPGRPEVFAVGDIASATDAATGGPVPGVAQGAIQGGRHAGRLIAEEIRAGRRGDDVRRAEDRTAFRYRNKGEMATIGRSRAVADLGFARFGGWFAWLLWSLVHVVFLVGFRNKLLVMADWVWQYVTFGRGARLITGQRLRTRRFGGGDPDEERSGGDADDDATRGGIAAGTSAKEPPARQVA